MTADEAGYRVDKVWFVTASRDLGRALVERLIDRGPRVAPTTRATTALAGPSQTLRRPTTSSSRVEAFSDAVFAITITLLVVQIGRPQTGTGHLGRDLLHQWPQYAAFAVSFLYIGVVWLNHHELFARIRDVNFGLSWINLGLLGSSALLPLPTAVLAAAFTTGTNADRCAAAVMYSAVGALVSIAWIPIFPYLRRHPELLENPDDAPAIGAERSRPFVGIASYILAAAGAYLVDPWVAIALFFWMILYHGVTSQGLESNRLSRKLRPSSRSDGRSHHRSMPRERCPSGEVAEHVADHVCGAG